MLMDTSFAGHLMAFQDSYVTPIREGDVPKEGAVIQDLS